MSDIPYWQQRRDLKNGKGVKSADLPESAGKAAKKAAPPKTSAKGFKRQNKAINKRSVKQKGIMKALASLYGPYLKEHPYCVIQSPDCQREATCVNHKKGRGVNVVLDKKFWEPSCGPCNSYIEANDAWARENGHKVSRLEKDKNNS